MRTETTATTIYKFDELSEKAKAKAVDNHRNSSVDDDYWYEYIFEDTKEVGEILGITIDNIHFSGFASQGDGAQFTGSYHYAKGSCEKIQSHAPQDTDLHSIAERLYTIQKTRFYGLYAYITHRGHYSHENCTDIDVRLDETEQPIPADDITECLRDFMRWIYRRLEKEYYWLTADEQVTANLIDNDMEFLVNGSSI